MDPAWSLQYVDKAPVADAVFGKRGSPSGADATRLRSPQAEWKVDEGGKQRELLIWIHSLAGHRFHDLIVHISYRFNASIIAKVAHSIFPRCLGPYLQSFGQHGLPCGRH